MDAETVLVAVGARTTITDYAKDALKGDLTSLSLQAPTCQLAVSFRTYTADRVIYPSSE